MTRGIRAAQAPRRLSRGGWVRPLGCFCVAILGVGQQHNRGQQQKQGDRAEDEPGERGREVGLFFDCHYFAPPPGPLETLAFDKVSFGLIFGTTSIPSMTFPNTVCTPFRCLVFCSLSTMKN